MKPGPGRHRGGVPLRAEDAFFLHAQTTQLSQQVGALLLLEPSPIRAADFRTAMRQRMAAAPALRLRLERPGSRWRRPRWITDDHIDFSARIRPVSLGENGAPGSLGEVVDSFFSAPCDPGRNPWEMLLVHGLPLGRTAVVVKVHHAVGDSHAIIATLSQLFDEAAAHDAPGLGRPATVSAAAGNPPSRRASRNRVFGQVFGLETAIAAAVYPGTRPISQLPADTRLVLDSGDFVGQVSGEGLPARSVPKCGEQGRAAAVF